MWILATVSAPFLGWFFRHLQPVWRGRSSLRRSLAQVLRLTCSPVQSVLTAWLGHTHQPSGLFFSLGFYTFLSQRFLSCNLSAFTDSVPMILQLTFLNFFFPTILKEETIWLLSWCCLFLCANSFFVFNIFFLIVLWFMSWKKPDLFLISKYAKI